MSGQAYSRETGAAAGIHRGSQRSLLGPSEGKASPSLLSRTLGCSVGPQRLVELPWVLLSFFLVGPRFAVPFALPLIPLVGALAEAMLRQDPGWAGTRLFEIRPRTFRASFLLLIGPGAGLLWARNPWVRPQPRFMDPQQEQIRTAA